MNEKHHPFLHHRTRRLHIVIMLMYAFFCMCQMTAPIGLSLSCMCNSTAIAHLNNSGTSKASHAPLISNISSDNLSDEKSCRKLEGKVVKDYGGDLIWTVDMQGYVVSAAFLGGVIFSYPSGYAVDRYSARHLLSISIIILTASSFFLPVLSRVFGVYGAIVARFFMGVSESLLIPSINSVVTKWIPLHEKSLAASIFTAGNQISGIFGNPLVATICASSLGWPAIFYSSTIFGLIWLILWHTTVRNSPQNTKWIDSKELDYLSNHITSKRSPAIKRGTPWAAMLKSSAFWCLMYNSVMGNMMIALIFIYIPVYFKDVLMLDVQANGFYTALPHLANLIAKLLWGYLMDKLRQRKILSPTATVKLSQAASMFGISIACFFLRKMDCSTPISALILLSGICCAFGLSISGFYTSLLSIAPSHIGTLTSIGSVIGFFGRMLTPLLISHFKTVGTAEEWGNVFLVYVVAAASAAISFILFGSGEVQEWDYSKRHPQSKPNVLIAPEPSESA